MFEGVCNIGNNLNAVIDDDIVCRFHLGGEALPHPHPHRLSELALVTPADSFATPLPSPYEDAAHTESAEAARADTPNPYDHPLLIPMKPLRVVKRLGSAESVRAGAAAPARSRLGMGADGAGEGMYTLPALQLSTSSLGVGVARAADASRSSSRASQRTAKPSRLGS